MTGATEAEIRAFMEHYPADNWQVTADTFGDYIGATGDAFEDFIESARITDDDFSVFSEAHRDEIEAIMPAINAALRPLMIEAQVRATVRFFERFPEAPRRPQLIPAS